MKNQVPPSSPEAERGFIGCVLLNPATNHPTAVMLIPAGEEVFFEIKNRVIWNSINKLMDKYGTVDMVTLQQSLKDAGQLKTVGDVAYLAELFNCAGDITQYAEILNDKWVARRLIVSATEISNAAYENNGQALDALEDAEKGIMKIRQGLETGRGKRSVKDLEIQLIEEYGSAFDGKGIPGILTGFGDLDMKLGGLQGQEMIVVAGTPSAGKTCLLLNIALHAARAKVKVSIASLDGSAKKMIHRLNCIAGKVNGTPFLRGNPNEEDMRKIQIGINEIHKLSEYLLIHDESMNEAQLIANARQDYQAGARLFMVDYLQLIASKEQGETERITSASKTVKNIAKMTDCPIIAVSSLSRTKTESGKPRRPTLQDFRQSGQIEYDAEKAIMLYCEDVTQSVRKVEADVLKNKDGPLGMLEMVFFAGQFRFEQAARSGPTQQYEAGGPADN